MLFHKPSPIYAFRFASISLFVFIVLSILNDVLAAPDGLIRAANQAAAEYRKEIESLADWVFKQGLDDKARQTRAVLMPTVRDLVFIPTFPLESGTLDLPRALPNVLPKEYAASFRKSSSIVSLPEEQNTSRTSKSQTGDSENYEFQKNAIFGTKTEQEKKLTIQEVWQIQFRSLRQNYAKELYTLARRAAKDNRGTLAVQLAVAGLHADPDHQGFRTVFGFTKYKNQWRTSWEADRLKKSFVDHETFGWIPQKAVERYEKGERFCNGKWIDSDKEKMFRGEDIKDGWKIESEHYDLLTNHSHEEGVRLIRQLEDLYRAWKLLFFRFMATDAQLASLFDGKASSTRSHRHKVVIYKDKADFVRNLQPTSKDNVDLYAGFYIQRGGDGACHFYAVEANASDWHRRNVVRTMFHEATHQLFVESRKTVTNYGKNYNYWLVEGVAKYMETLRRNEDGYYVLGSPRNAVAANLSRRNLKMLDFSEIVQINASRFRDHHVQGESLYGQSEAMFHFLFNYEDGRWRDAMTIYLRALYDEKDDEQTLTKSTGCSFRELDTAFDAWLKGE